MFKDTSDGQTHSFNDGCGEPAHNPLPSPTVKSEKKYYGEICGVRFDVPTVVSGCCGEWTGKEPYDCDRDGARTKQGTCPCSCHTATNSTSWEEEFARLLVDFINARGNYGDIEAQVSWLRTKIEPFVHTQISLAEKRVREEMSEKICEIIVQTDWSNDSVSGLDRLTELSDVEARNNTND